MKPKEDTTNIWMVWVIGLLLAVALYVLTSCDTILEHRLENCKKDLKSYESELATKQAIIDSLKLRTYYDTMTIEKVIWDTNYMDYQKEPGFTNISGDDCDSVWQYWYERAIKDSIK